MNLNIILSSILSSNFLLSVSQSQTQTMNPSLLFISLLLLITSHNPNPVSAHFFPNFNSIPPSLIPNTTTWDAFNNLVDCSHGQKANGLAKLKRYFQYFGYLNNSYTNFSDEFDDSLKSAIKTYQLNFNLNATGELDEQTLKHIVQPRCGGPDIVNGTSTMLSGKFKNVNPAIHAVKHYTFFPDMPRWPASKRQLTYAFLPGNQLSDAVKSVFSRSFQRWEKVTPLTFVEATSYNGADIRIGFYSGDHGDGEPFDGVLGTLAHAFSPPVGRFHLDGDENWVIDGDFSNDSPLSGVDLETVAVHEIGHLLGLGHSSDREAIMYPSITTGTRKVELANDDITGIQVLYGSNPNNNGSTSNTNQNPTPWQERDTSGEIRVDYSLLARGIPMAVGLFLLLV